MNKFLERTIGKGASNPPLPESDSMKQDNSFSQSDLAKMRSKARGAFNKFLGIFAGVFIFFFLFMCLLPAAGASYPFQFFCCMATGWASFPQEEFYQIIPDFSSLFIGLVLFLLFAICFKYIVQSQSKKEGGNKIANWSLRVWGVVVLLSCVSFIAGSAIMGVANQISLLANSKKPNFISNYHMFDGASRRKIRDLGEWINDYEESKHVLPNATYSQNGKALHSFFTNLLPFVGQENLYEQINLKVAWDEEKNLAQLSQHVEAYFFTSDKMRKIDPVTKLATTNYAGNVRVIGRNTSLELEDITDGASNTILLGEVSSLLKPWGKPGQLRDPAIGINKHPYGFGSPNGGPLFILYADGRYSYLNPHIDPQLLKALSTPCSGDDTENY